MGTYLKRVEGFLRKGGCEHKLLQGPVKTKTAQKKMSVSIEKVQKVVAGVRRELKDFFEKDEGVGNQDLATFMDAELDTHSNILFHLETCHDSETAQNIAKQILARVKALYAYIPKGPNDPRLSTSGSSIVQPQVTRTPPVSKLQHSLPPLMNRSESSPALFPTTGSSQPKRMMSEES